VSAAATVAAIQLVKAGRVSRQNGRKVLAELAEREKTGGITGSGSLTSSPRQIAGTAEQVAQELGVLQVSDSGEIDGWVREEIATREAMALGLDKDDAVIRRRLRQKLEFVSDDIADQTEPTDADLNAYLQAHPKSFRVEPAFTFSQVYLDPAKHGDNLGRDTAQLLARLNQAGGNADTSTLGDSLLLDDTFQSVPASEVAKQFGEEFAAKLSGLSPGQWQGPVESGYGIHLVLISERTEGRLPELADVRDAVRREWANARRVEENERFYQELSKRYTVTIEGLTGAN